MKRKQKFWKPSQVGDGIQGAFVEWERSQFKDMQGNDVYTAIIMAEVEPGFEMKKTLPKQCTTPLWSERPKLGDMITVVYEGEIPSKGEYPTKVYKITVAKK